MTVIQIFEEERVYCYWFPKPSSRWEHVLQERKFDSAVLTKIGLAESAKVLNQQ